MEKISLRAEIDVCYYTPQYFFSGEYLRQTITKYKILLLSIHKLGEVVIFVNRLSFLFFLPCDCVTNFYCILRKK